MKSNTKKNLLYSKLSEVCHSFYRLYFPHQKIAFIINNHLKKYNCKKVVFFGGLIYVAKILQEKNYEITFVDYTKEMVNEAQKILKDINFIVSDIRDLNLKEKEQDAIVLVGRIFTYMYTDDDVIKTLSAFKNNLKSNGIVIIDNYEIGKMELGNYFNGIIELKDKNNHILRRISKIIRIVRKQKHPALYNWNCVYEDIFDGGGKKVYEDKNHLLRAFTKEEVKKLVEKSGLKFIKHEKNFEDRSFITIAQKIM